MMFQRMTRGAVVLTLALLYPGLTALAQDNKVPLTASDEAVEFYLQGRDLSEKLRGTDALEYFELAAAEDEDFALAYWALALNSATTADFFENYEMAVQKADMASDGERNMIMALDAAVKGDPEAQEKYLLALVKAYPNDERAHNLLGIYYNGRQDYEKAIEQWEKAIAINPDFSPPYNSGGYAYRAIGEYDKAEQSFKKYISLIPDDPNPYDSYAELLMKLGRFEESIAQFENALERDPNIISYRGIGANQIFMGEPDMARETFETMGELARTDGELRTALAWVAASYVFEGETDMAMEALEARYAVAEEDEDAAAMSGDQVFMGTVLLEADRTEPAMEHFDRSVEIINEADVPPEVKANVARNNQYYAARVSLADGDISEAKLHAGAYATEVKEHEIPFEMRRVHELTGSIALAEGNWNQAIAHLKQANQQDPRILYMMALAYDGAGDKTAGRAMMEKAANFNGLNFNYAYVRADAMAALEE
jgi:tetratricopeptide (TPR) repeat protein